VTSSTAPASPTAEAGATPGAAPKQRLSTAQMLHLMRLEMERALRHGYPISALVVGLDGFDEEHHLPWRRAIMPAVFQELKAVTFKNDVRGLGVWTERFQLAIFPHVTPDRLTHLAEELRYRAAALKITGVPESETVVLSAGIAHNLHPGPKSFETLIEEAETGMGLAQSGGGNKVVQAREVERELDKLREEVDSQIQEIQEFQSKLFADVDSKEDMWGRELVSKVIELFKREPEKSEGVLRVEKEVIALLKAELAAWRETSTASRMLESQRTIGQLERRVAKLTESLGITEAELKRVAALKNIDLGVSSIYRTVQGLSGTDGGAEQKKEMLKNIFEANMSLRAQLSSLS
jgi:GGDEF domain-containing protein